MVNLKFANFEKMYNIRLKQGNLCYIQVLTIFKIIDMSIYSFPILKAAKWNTESCQWTCSVNNPIYISTYLDAILTEFALKGSKSCTIYGNNKLQNWKCDHMVMFLCK